MKLFEIAERYESAFSSHDAKYLVAAESESQARETAERKVGAKKPHLSNGVTVVEIFDSQRIDRLEERLSLIEKERIGVKVWPADVFRRIAARLARDRKAGYEAEKGETK